ncbi:MAG: FtsX-like permease family protein [Bacteroidales bacterium]|nr:FtsX-like permease family protein [Bacteroidales bacterium]
MFKNYLKIAFRRFWRQKAFTIINVLGLSSGLAISLVMLISVKFQLSFDDFHANSKNIYKIGVNLFVNNEEIRSLTCAGIWGEEIQNNYPEVIMKTRLLNSGELLFNLYNEKGEVDKKFVEDNGVGVDSTFFQMFTFPLLHGEAEDVLKEPYSIVLSEEFAKKYFGAENPIGKTLEINNNYNFKVTGVLAELPENTQLGFDYYFQVSFFEEFGIDVNGTIGNSFQTYLLLENGVAADNISATLKDFLYTRFDRDLEYEPFLLSVEKMIMYGESSNFIFTSIFVAIAIFILIMACINFMNLSTASSIKRSKEIAIRKIVGAHRKQLIKQLLTESILLSFISLNIAIVISELIIEFFHRFFGMTIPLDLSDFKLWFQLIILSLVTGLLSGSYPAIFLSSFKPIKVLSFSHSHGSGGKFRKILVVFQFVLSILFLTMTSLSYNQYQAVLKNKIGLETQQVLSVPIKGEIYNKYELIKNDLLQNPNILSVSTSDQEPTWITMGEFLWGTSPGKNENLSRLLRVNYDFLDVFSIKLKEGRAFSKNYPSDLKKSIIVNEEIVNQLGIKDPIGSQFYLYDKPYTIIGVVEYFDFFPIEMGGKSLIVKLEPPKSGNVYLKYQKGNYPYVADYIKETFEKHNTMYPYEISYYSDYKSPIEEGMKNMNNSLTFFTLFGVFIAALGLLGLSAFMVEQKTKEIGIRKAMGASVQKIVSIITKQFFKLILIANLIALPISFIIRSYAGKFLTVKANGDIFIFAGVFVFIFAIAFAIIYLVTIKAARANPARSLRYE